MFSRKTQGCLNADGLITEGATVQLGNGQHLNVPERIRHHRTRDQVGPTHDVLSGGRTRGRSASIFRAWLAGIIHQLATSTAGPGGHWIYRKQPGHLTQAVSASSDTGSSCSSSSRLSAAAASACARSPSRPSAGLRPCLVFSSSALPNASAWVVSRASSSGTSREPASLKYFRRTLRTTGHVGLDGLADAQSYSCNFTKRTLYRMN